MGFGNPSEGFGNLNISLGGLFDRSLGDLRVLVTHLIASVAIGPTVDI